MKIIKYLAATVRLRRALRLGLILTSLLAALPAYAGGESSAGGADDFRVVSAFFRSWNYRKPVTACIQSTGDFGVPGPILESMVRDGWRAWAEYIVQKRLTLVPSHELIRTQLELRAACLGDENLVFYFGVENEQIKQYRGQFSKPFGFAQLVEEGQPWDGGIVPQGFVWIAPRGAISAKDSIPLWGPTCYDALAGLVLHEIGHVFGNGHVDGTVMTERIGEYLENDTATGQTEHNNVARYSKIDSQIELVPCMECHQAYSAAETFDEIQSPGADTASDWIFTFKRLTGNAPVPPLVIRYEKLGSPQGSGRLTLMDATGMYPFDVAVEMEASERIDSTPLFAGQGGKTFYSFAKSYIGRIRTLAGVDLPVVVNYNMDGKKAEIKPIGEGFYPRPIFVSAD